jgi:hypothetical protein
MIYLVGKNTETMEEEECNYRKTSRFLPLGVLKENI